MNYPVWDVPVIGSGWVIGIIAIVHVMISHFAVGGGFYLPMAERKALRENRPEWLEVIKGHSKFFLVLTAVAGAMTGVGIWFAIGLANPEGTSTLIHNFVFMWAIEYAFFLTEIAAAAVYYYTWGKVSDRMHLAIGWVYAISAWMSLFVINGILTFMLTPGDVWLTVEQGQEPGALFWAFFNPTYWPSLFLRTVIMLTLAGLWAFVTASRINSRTQGRLKTDVMRWSVKWMIPGFVLLPFLFAWYVARVPEDQLALLGRGISTIGQGTFTQVTRAALVTIMTSATIVAIAYFFAWRHPRDFKLGHALALLALGFAATAATEYAREMLRKPYVVVGHIFSNGVRVREVESFNANGYLARSPWVKPGDRELWEQIDVLHAQEAEQAAALAQGAGPEAETGPFGLALAADTDLLDANRRRGELMFRGQCMACHTVDGYRSMRRLLAQRDRAAIGNILSMLQIWNPPAGESEPAEAGPDNPYGEYMPPLVGSAPEVRALGDYLATLVHPQHRD
jgi:cytochrome bd-type quinol oxidase subunit 1/mono/diheme cytochrome c family protein